MKILIASSNKGKIAEIMDYMDDLPMEFLSLSDIDVGDIVEPEETSDTLDGNSLLKAKYYADKTGYITLADDAGIFIDALSGAPGVYSARFAPTDEQRRQKVLEQLDGAVGDARGASFRTVLTLYNPKKEVHFSSLGETRGVITEEEVLGKYNWGYNPIFMPNDVGKCYSQFDMNDKHAYGHRGKALAEIKNHLHMNYEPRNIIAAVGIVINDRGEVLMNLRNDPVNKNAHNKWEFPGGTIDFGETIEESAVREVREESGYDVEVIRRLDYVMDKSITNDDGFQFHLILIPVLCEHVGGDGVYRDAEVLESRWFPLDEVKDYELLDGNIEMWQNIRESVDSLILKKQNHKIS
jgi:XTP/dITP diphosphohydrolase